MKQMQDRHFYKRLLSLALPITLQNIIGFGSGLADNLMVGQLSENALGGVFIANQVQNILQMIVIGLGTSLTVLAAQYWGKGETGPVKTIVSIVFKIALAVGTLFFLGMFFFGRPILHLLSDEPGVLDEAMIYARVVCFGYFFFCVSSVFMSSMRCVGTTRIGLIVSSCAFCIDLFLNWVLIFGKLGAPAMGIRGAALSTVIGRIIECLIMLFYILYKDRKLKLRPRDIRRYDRFLMRDYIHYGTPIILGDVFWGLGGAAQASILGRLGAPVMAASSMAGNIQQIFAVAVYGTAGASGIVIGQTVGTGDFERVKAYSKKLQFVFLGIGLCSGLLLFGAKDLVLRLYGNLEPETLRYATQFIMVLSVTLVGTGYQMSVLTGIVRAGGATHFVLINDLIFVWLVVIPSASLSAFVFHASPWIVYACLKCDQILKCFVAVIKVNRFRWIKKLTRDSLEAYE